jgi:hypothetical protein
LGCAVSPAAAAAVAIAAQQHGSLASRSQVLVHNDKVLCSGSSINRTATGCSSTKNFARVPCDTNRRKFQKYHANIYA